MHASRSEKVCEQKQYSVVKLVIARVAHGSRPEMALYNRHFKAGEVKLDRQMFVGFSTNQYHGMVEECRESCMHNFRSVEIRSLTTHDIALQI